MSNLGAWLLGGVLFLGILAVDGLILLVILSLLTP